VGHLEAEYIEMKLTTVWEIQSSSSHSILRSRSLGYIYNKCLAIHMRIIVLEDEANFPTLLTCLSSRQTLALWKLACRQMVEQPSAAHRLKTVLVDRLPVLTPLSNRIRLRRLDHIGAGSSEH
jgi:hypothetical protein